jgi:hypothetical protein
VCIKARGTPGEQARAQTRFNLGSSIHLRSADPTMMMESDKKKTTLESVNQL